MYKHEVTITSNSKLTIIICYKNTDKECFQKCIQYCSDSGFSEAVDLAVRLNQRLTLDETHLNRLKKIIGDDLLVFKENE